MKKILLMVVVMVTSNLFSQTGNVGIGTSTPYSSSILDLTATDKALLLPRVANAAAVATPTNGMMVYDISQKCVIGYENSAWSGCLSSSGGTPPTPGGDDFGLDFTSTVKQIASGYDGNGSNTSGLIATDGKVFLWGQNTSFSFFTGEQKPTPVYSPLPNGELAQKIAIGNTVAMALTTTGKVYIMGIDIQNTWPAFGGIAVARQWTQLTIAGETSFADVQTSPWGRNSFVRGASGKVYRSGWGNTYSTPERVAPYTAMLFPAGVTSYTDMWVDGVQGSGPNIFLKGNDNNIYAAGANVYGQLGIGNTTNVNLNVAPVKVIFPAGVNNVVKISSSDRGISLAITADGKAYGWGRWRDSNIVNYFAATPVAGALSGNTLLLPSPLVLPTLNSDTIFTDVLAGSGYSVVKTDKMTYFKGYNYSSILMNPVTSDTLYYTNSLIDGIDGSKYNLAAPVWNRFKTIITGGSPSDGINVFAISQSDKAYVWGRRQTGVAGVGGGIDAGFLQRPTPIATGIGDPLNTNPLY